MFLVQTDVNLFVLKWKELINLAKKRSDNIEQDKNYGSETIWPRRYTWT